MYRIDENTYIDDTLITCAEYQLFIDEIRAQGKYYQPDHWTSYQFPAGQAHQPILGVRHSDAVAFCEWLSQRGNKEWNYRLATEQETAQRKLKPYKKTPLGYWLANNQFEWIGPTPTDPREFNTTIPLDHTRTQTLSLNYAHDLDITLDIARDINIAIARDRDLALVQAITLASTRNLDRMLARTLALARARDLARDLDLDIGRDHDLTRARALARYLAQASSSNLDINLDIVVSAKAYPLNRAFELVLGLYIDVVTLQERIAGHSPAFEGIRIVKERQATNETTSNRKDKPQYE